MKYNVVIPAGRGRFNASSRKDAIDQALKVWRLQLDKMVESGDIYRIPDLCKEWVPRNSIKELRNEQPVKPSSKLGKRVR